MGVAQRQGIFFAGEGVAMPGFSKRSQGKLDSCHPDLVRLFTAVVKEFDCSIIEGHRGRIRQDKLYRAGASKVEYPDGGHNKCPSEAVDAIAYPLDWGDSHRHCYFAGYVKGVAQKMGIKIRWGGDWDNDTQVKDQTFNDRVHFELIREG